MPFFLSFFLSCNRGCWAARNHQILNVHMFGLCKMSGLQRLGKFYMNKSECAAFAVTRWMCVVVNEMWLLNNELGRIVVGNGQDIVSGAVVVCTTGTEGTTENPSTLPDFWTKIWTQGLPVTNQACLVLETNVGSKHTFIHSSMARYSASFFKFNVHGSVHRKYILIYIQQDATLHSLFISGNPSTCFGWYLHPSSGAHTTVSTASGTCQIVTATCRYCGGVGTLFQHLHDSGR